MKTPREKIYLIDGSGFIFRAFHALPPLNRNDGTQVGAVLGFCNILLKLLDSQDINKITVVFDCKRQNYRHEIYEQYKANRKETPEDLIPQFAIIREACDAFGIHRIELEGYEADDIIATYTKQSFAQGYDTIIVSSDKDLMQLIGDNVSMLDPIKNKILSYPEVEQKFFATPDKVIDIQALAGDSSDNVPGVPGIGLKTAAQLINEFETLENLLNNLDKIPQPKRRQSLIANSENAILSKKLVTLHQEVPLTLTVKDLEFQSINYQKLYDFLQKQNFDHLINRMRNKGLFEYNENNESKNHSDLIINKISQETKQKYYIIKSIDELKQWLNEAIQYGIMAFDTETTSLTPEKATLIGCSISFKLGIAAYIPLNHNHDNEPDLPTEKVLSLLKEVLENSATIIVGQNIKYDMRIMLQYGVEINAYQDTMLMSYNLDGLKYRNNLDELTLKYCNHQMISYDELIKSAVNKDITTIPLDKIAHYASEDADFTLRLYYILQAKMFENKNFTVYKTIDLPLVKILAVMEHQGITIDKNHLNVLDKEFEKIVNNIEEEIFTISDANFNIASPKQLGEILFEKLKLNGGKKSKSGAYATNIEVLETLRDQGVKIADKIITWRQYTKLRNTYTQGLVSEIIEKTQKVHTNYGFLTLSGRLSSSEPNLQNIPIRSNDGRKIRQAFIARPNYKLVSFDYSQIELRLLAHVAGMESLIECFRNGEDIHKKTASEIFNIDITKVDKNLRRAAKAINFGIIYGVSPFGLAKQLKISRNEASEYIAKYNERYTGLSDYVKYQQQFAVKNGYVNTIFGRKCYILGINSGNTIQRNFALRQAINAPLQGSAADIIKKAMNNVTSILKSYNNHGVIDANKINSFYCENELGENKTLALFNTDKFKKLKLPEGVSIGTNNLKSSVNKEIKAIHSIPIFPNENLSLNDLVGEKIKLLLQVHDELVFEIHADIINEVVEKIQKIMEQATTLKVPLIATYQIGQSWDYT